MLCYALSIGKLQGLVGPFVIDRFSNQLALIVSTQKKINRFDIETEHKVNAVSYLLISSTTYR